MPSEYGKLTSGKKQITGREQSTEKTFASIPGLKLWLQPPFGVKIDSSNRISKILDLSGNGNDFSRSSLASQPFLASSSGFSYINFTASPQSLLNNSQNFKFFHSGLPFGLFIVVKTPDITTTSSSNIFTSEGPGTSNRGVALNLDSRESITPTNVIYYRIAVGAAPYLASGVYNGNGTGWQSADVNYWSMVYYGQTNPTSADLTLSVNGAQVSSTNTGATVGNTGDNIGNRILGSSFIGEVYCVLAYDWNAMTITDVASLTTEVNSLIDLNFAAIIP